jgi:hypothetical protein
MASLSQLLSGVVKCIPHEIGLLGVAAFTFGGIALVLLVDVWFFAKPLPPGMALVREPPGATSFSLRTRLAYFTDCKALFREAYDEVSQSRSLAMKCILTRAPVPKEGDSRRHTCFHPELRCLSSRKHAEVVHQPAR